MSGIFWKEVRENFLWAVLGMIGFGIALAYGWSTVFAPNNWQSYQSILSPSFLMVTTFGAPILGMALGFLQIMPERLRDRWAFLIHRPVTPNRIFWGKAAAGLTLYFPAALIPFLLAGWHASMPGAIAAPFDWAMIRPGLADIFCGALFYFGALLTALRETKWFGSKAFGLLAALGCSAVVSGAGNSLLQTREALLVGLPILMVAAWGAFCANGEFNPQPRLAKAALALVLFFGAAELFGLVSTLAEMTVQRPPWNGQQYQVDLQGRILRMQYKYGQLNSVSDVQGNPVPVSAEMKERTEKWLAGPGLLQSLRDSFPEMPKKGHESYRIFENYFSDPGYTDGMLWFYAPKQGFSLGYHRQNRTLEWIGGVEGFVHSERPKPQPFGPLGSVVSQNNNPLLLKKDTVYSLDWVELQAYRLWTPQAGETLLAAGVALPSWESDFNEMACVLQTNQHILGMTMKGDPLFEVAAPSFEKTYLSQYCFFIPKDNRFFIEYRPDGRKYSDDERKKMPFYMQEIDAKNSTVTMTEMPPLPEWHASRPWTKCLDFLNYRVWNDANSVLSAWIGKAIGSEEMEDSFRWNRDHFHGYLRHNLIPDIITGLLAAAIAAGLLWRRLVWERGCWGLLALVFLGGLAGLVALWFWFDWPRVEACPACGKRRRTDLEACPGCGAGWPEPVRDGTEILTFGGENV